MCRIWTCIEVWDAFSIYGMLSVEACGLAARGRGLALDRERIYPDGDMPLVTMGGNKARGFPLGAAGVYQAVEAITAAARRGGGKPGAGRENRAGAGDGRAGIKCDHAYPCASLINITYTQITNLIVSDSVYPLQYTIKKRGKNMEIPRHWRLQKQRYGLVGEECPHCSAKIFPAAGCLPGMRRRGERTVPLQRKRICLFLYCHELTRRPALKKACPIRSRWSNWMKARP